jgi:DNA-directed RNA polymerase specialized sigma subunit
MTAKQYLSQIRRIKMRVAALSEQLACMKEVAGLASSVLSDIPHSPNRNIHKLENEVIKQIEWEEKIQSELNLLEEINSTIAAVADPTLHTLLVKRYVDGETWEKIATELFISIRQVYRFHDDALAEIEKLAVHVT